MKKLAFLIIPLFSLFFTSNSFALQHNYDSLLTSDRLYIPPAVQDSYNLWYYDFSSTDFSGDAESGFVRVDFPSSFNADFQPYREQGTTFLESMYLFNQFSYSNGHCDVLGSTYQFRSNWVRATGTSLGQPYNYVSIYGRPIFADGYNPTHSTHYNLSGDTFKCYTEDHAPYQFNNESTFTLRYFDNSVVSNSGVNYNPEDISGFSGLDLRQSDTYEDSGTTYTRAFSFSKLFDGSNGYLPYVRKLHIPLTTSDAYFSKFENLTRGRQLEWHLFFNFDDSLEFPEDMTQTYSHIRLYGLPRNAQSSSTRVEQFHDCTMRVNNTVVNNSNQYQLEFTCPVTLDRDFAGFEVVDFELGNNNDDYVFYADIHWRIGSIILLTDNDYSDGYNFNTDLNDKMWGINNGDSASSDDVDWIESLSRLFNFSLPYTPLGLLFGSFNNTTCAHIPTLAGMLHSNETDICPWFSAETRAITTPILSLFSGMLLFGFIIHWLGSSSGNYEGDSPSDGEGYSISSSGVVSHHKGYRRK